MADGNFKMTRFAMQAVVVLICIVWLCGCGGSSGQQKDAGGAISGTIRVSGAWALYPMMVRWGEEFQKLHPGVRIDISAGGAGKGVSDALGGLVDVGMISRDIKPEEIKKGAFFVPVAKDAVFPVMNSRNTAFNESIQASGLTRSRFIELWIDGKPLTWGELCATDPRELVNVYTRSDSCGAAETWAQYLGANQEDLRGTGVYGDPGVAEAVRQDVLGIGYNNLNYAFDPTTGLPLQGLQVIPIDINENGVIDPEENLGTKQKAIDAVLAGVYPSPPARNLFLMTKEEFTGITKDFIEWILTDGQAFLDEVGYIPVGDDALAEALAKLRV